MIPRSRLGGEELVFNIATDPVLPYIGVTTQAKLADGSEVDQEKLRIICQCQQAKALYTIMRLGPTENLPKTDE
jgi:hypothetical protein